MPHLTHPRPASGGCPIGHLQQRAAPALLFSVVRKGVLSLDHPDWRPETSFPPGPSVQPWHPEGGPQATGGRWPPSCHLPGHLLQEALPGGSQPATLTHRVLGQEGELPGAEGLRSKGPLSQRHPPQEPPQCVWHLCRWLRDDGSLSRGLKPPGCGRGDHPPARPSREESTGLTSSGEEETARQHRTRTRVRDPRA